MNICSISHFYRSINPENLVKVGLVDSEITWLVSRPLKYRVGQKRPVLRVDNFATVNGKNACDMSKVLELCLEKGIEQACQCI